MDEKAKAEIIEVLADRFILTTEQARHLLTAYFLCGSCDEGLETAYNYFGLSKEVIRQVFAALDDLFHNPEYDPDV
jgi:hypothetical protein